MSAVPAPDALEATRRLKRFAVRGKVADVNTFLFDDISSGVHAEDIKVDVGPTA
jgi:enoyl-[acyl-carrier-protein] reductase (NADH)